MPGIVGLITKMPRSWAEPQLQRMVQALKHEHFYGSGTWINETLGVYVGWSVRERPSSLRLPITNADGEIVLVFAGEEIRQPAGSTGDNDPDGLSHLVRMYQQDPTFPLGINGRFQAIIADTKTGNTSLFNDRYGMGRIYFHESNEAFYFGAEAKAILAVRPELRRPNPRSLGEYVACGCVLENRTLFDDIHIMPQGSLWRFKNGSLVDRRTYFDPKQWEDQAPLALEEYYQELKEVFSRVLPRYLNGNEPIGMSLTGGLDTRAVMAWQRFPPGRFPCYTYGGMFRECYDVAVARKIADECQQPYDVITVGKDFLSKFASYAERSIYLADGCIDLLRCPDLYVSERAREIAPVRVTGLYGDEVLRLSRAFKPIPPSVDLFRPEFFAQVAIAKTTYGELIKQHPLTFAAFRQAPWHHYGILALEQTQLTVRTPFLDNDLVRTLYRAPQAAVENNDLRLRLIGDGSAPLRKIRTDLGFGGDANLYASAMRAYLKFTFKAEYAYDYGMPQWLARLDHIFSGLHLERLFIGRHKVYHFRLWYRNELRGYVKEMLLDRRSLSRPYVNGDEVEKIVEGHTRGTSNYTLEIHKLLSLELIHRLFFD